MIQYTLQCEDGHRSESWFRSAADFDTLAKAGHLSCGICGSPKVSKALMAPRVNVPAAREEAGPQDAQAAPMMNTPTHEVAKAVAALRQKVEESSDYVGDRFTEEARAMHLGDKPERSIWGEARPEQAKSLIEDGVPLLPLPFKPKNKLS